MTENSPSQEAADERPLGAPILIGLDAGQYELGSAILACLESHGFNALGKQREPRFIIDMGPLGQITVQANDEYFDPYEGGQSLAGLYPLVAYVDADSTVARRVFETLASDRGWAMLLFSGDGLRLLKSHSPASGTHTFRRPVHRMSDQENWARWIQEPPWPTLA